MITMHGFSTKRARIAVSVIAMSSLMPVAIGCEETTTCTLIGCAPNEFRLVMDDWAPGDYEIDVSYSLSGDVSFRCSLRVDEAAGDDDAGVGTNEPTCTQLTGSTRSVDLLRPRGEPTLRVFDSPANLQITLRDADQTLFDDTITPDHTTSFPNGPDCGDCRTASMSIDIR